MGRVLAQLRETGLLEESLIVVTADHGYAFEVGVPDRRLLTDSNIDEIAPVPLFVKAPGQRVGRVNRGYPRNLDIVPTIARLLGWRVYWPHDGRSAYGRQARGRRMVRIPTRGFKRVVHISATELERRRQANRLTHARLYGTGLGSRLLFGDPWATLYRTGPHSELLGRPLAGFRVTSPGRVRAHLYDARLTHSVDHRARVVPVKLAGEVRGGRGLRKLVVAVNGRIRGTGRSFRLTDRHVENFSVLVPEVALRDGDNEVRILALHSRGGAVELVPLGRN
jgi:hypothetical protein